MSEFNADLPRPDQKTITGTSADPKTPNPSVPYAFQAEPTLNKFNRGNNIKTPDSSLPYAFHPEPILDKFSFGPDRNSLAKLLETPEYKMDADRVAAYVQDKLKGINGEPYTGELLRSAAELINAETSQALGNFLINAMQEKPLNPQTARELFNMMLIDARNLNPKSPVSDGKDIIASDNNSPAASESHTDMLGAIRQNLVSEAALANPDQAAPKSPDAPQTPIDPTPPTT